MTFDPLVEERVADGVVVSRSASGNPEIVPRGELVPVEYDRASSMSEFLAKDVIGIKKWELRHLARALGLRPDLAALAAVEGYNTGLGLAYPILTPDENKASGQRLDGIIDRAFDHVALHEKADMGTVAHAATEPGFAGGIHPIVQGVVEAIHELTAALEVVATEVFVANDETRSAGTFDHGYYLADQRLAAELSEYFTEQLGFSVDLTGALIGDKKTGKNVHIGDFEIQLGGTYANGEVYLGPPIDMVDQRLTLEEFFGGPVNRTTGLLVHASTTGAPKPRVLPIDLARGRRLGLVAAMVRDARNELDKIGIPKKLPVDVIAKRVLSDEIELVLQDLQSGETTKEAGRAAGLALMARFRHIWTDAHTTAMKEALA